MMPIQWDTLVTNDAGAIDYARVRSLVAVLLALLGGLIVIVAVAIELSGAAVPHDALMIAVGALVLPLTGGKIADAFASKVSAP